MTDLRSLWYFSFFKKKPDLLRFWLFSAFDVEMGKLTMLHIYIHLSTVSCCRPRVSCLRKLHRTNLQVCVFSCLALLSLPVMFRWLITWLADSGTRGALQLEASSSSGLCCNNLSLHATTGDRASRCNGVNLDQLVRERNPGMLKLSPADEVEGEFIYYQQRLLCNAITRKRISGLYSYLIAFFTYCFVAFP